MKNPVCAGLHTMLERSNCDRRSSSSTKNTQLMDLPAFQVSVQGWLNLLHLLFALQDTDSGAALRTALTVWAASSKKAGNCVPPYQIIGTE